MPGSCSADFGETGKIKGFEHVRSNAIMPKQYLFLTSISFILIKYYQKWFNDCNMIMHFKSETAEWMNYYSLIGQFDCNRIYKVNKFNIIQKEIQGGVLGSSEYNMKNPFCILSLLIAFK